MRYIHRYVFSTEDADDLLVEVFLAAIENQVASKLNENEQLAWLRRVAHNKVIDHQRRAIRPGNNSSSFTIQYPASWVAIVIPQGTAASGIYAEQIEFRPSPTSSISFTVSTLYNGEMSPDTLLQNDSLYKSSQVDSTTKVTINGISWSTAILETQGAQLTPAKIKLAYANNLHPYCLEFSTPPAQFDTYSTTFNTIFNSFAPVN